MKRLDLIKAIEGFGCVLIRHGAKHDWYQNPAPESRNPCLGIVKSRSDWRVELSGFSIIRGPRKQIRRQGAQVIRSWKILLYRTRRVRNEPLSATLNSG